MGLSNFHTQAEGVLPILVMNTIFSVVLIKDLLKSMLQVVGSYGFPINLEERRSEEVKMVGNRGLGGNVSILRFESDLKSDNCSVCLCRFVDGEEVSELLCKHFFHTRCLNKWFDNQCRTCPLCPTMS